MMDIYLLRKEEVEYELVGRNIEGKGDLDTVRKKLRKAITSGISVDDKYVDMSEVEDEIEFSTSRVKEFEETITSKEGSLTRRAIQRLDARSYHWLERVIRAGRLAEEEESRNAFLELEQRIKLVMEHLERLREAQETEVEDEELEPRNVKREVETKQEHTPRRSEEENINQPVRLREKWVPVYKWNVKFSGDKHGMGVCDFIEKIDDLRAARGTSEQEVYQAAVELFDGIALTWFRSARERCKTWKQVCAELKIVFVDHEFEDNLREKIRKRIQGRDEPFDLYVATIEELCNRLEKKMDQEEKLKLVLKNMNNYLQDKLGMLPLENLETVRELARKAETIRARMKSRATEWKKLESVELQRKAEDIPKRKEEQTTSKVKCWKCGELGHYATTCKKPKETISCFGCGMNGVKKSECSKCNAVVEEIHGTCVKCKHAEQEVLPEKKPEPKEEVEPQKQGTKNLKTKVKKEVD